MNLNLFDHGDEKSDLQRELALAERQLAYAHRKLFAAPRVAWTKPGDIGDDSCIPSTGLTDLRDDPLRFALSGEPGLGVALRPGQPVSLQMARPRRGFHAIKLFFAVGKTSARRPPVRVSIDGCRLQQIGRAHV